MTFLGPPTDEEQPRRTSPVNLVAIYYSPSSNALQLRMLNCLQHSESLRRLSACINRLGGAGKTRGLFTLGLKMYYPIRFKVSPYFPPLYSQLPCIKSYNSTAAFIPHFQFEPYRAMALCALAPGGWVAYNTPGRSSVGGIEAFVVRPTFHLVSMQSNPG
jgi:hypothetical protein